MRYLIIAKRTEHFHSDVIQPHKQFLADLESQKRLELAGPFTDLSGGAYIIHAESLEHAQAIVYQDPIHTSGASQLTIYEWNAHSPN